MSQDVIAEWSGKEYEHDPKSADWYWALGIIATASAIACIIFSNYLFAILVLFAAAAIALHANKESSVHLFKLTSVGLMIGDVLHPFERMTSFTVLEDIEGKLPPLLSIKTESWHSPHLEIPLDGVDPDMVYHHLLSHVDEGEHHHTFVDLVAAWLGF